MIDCDVLKKGYSKFRTWILEALNLDIDNLWTIASMADKYLHLQGCYKEVEQLSGTPQFFIQKWLTSMHAAFILQQWRGWKDF